MKRLKEQWDGVVTNPAVMRKFNGWATIASILLIPVSLATGWVESVQYVSALSIWALVTGHLSGWQNSRLEEKQEEEDKKGVKRLEED